MNEGGGVEEAGGFTVFNTNFNNISITLWWGKK
jgi:hypothetical protein